MYIYICMYVSNTHIPSYRSEIRFHRDVGNARSLLGTAAQWAATTIIVAEHQRNRHRLAVHPCSFRAVVRPIVAHGGRWVLYMYTYICIYTCICLLVCEREYYTIKCMYNISSTITTDLADGFATLRCPVLQGLSQYKWGGNYYEDNVWTSLHFSILDPV